MATFNILGTCIIRDLFSVSLNKSKHTVWHFFNWASPTVHFFYKDKPSRKMEISHFDSTKDVMNFAERCVSCDYNKSVLENYVKKSDYFVIDLVSMVHTDLVQEVNAEGVSNTFTYSQSFIELLDKGLKEKFFKDSELKVIKALENRSVFKKVIENFVHWLINEQGYKQEQIILIKNRSVHHYSDGCYYLKANWDFEERNDVLMECYDYFSEKCPNCMVVEMPENVYSDYYHKWGFSDLHFDMSYYEYLFECIDLISNGEYTERKKWNIYNKYIRLFNQKIIALINNNLSIADNTNFINGGLSSNVLDKYIVPRNTIFFKEGDDSEYMLDCSKPVHHFSGDEGLFYIGETKCHTSKCNCVKGYTGTANSLYSNWRTQNHTTQVVITDYSVILGHNGLDEKFQSNLLFIIGNDRRLKGKPVTLSVLARVVNLNSHGTGGSIALINDCSYNRGVFLVHKDFCNTGWQRLYLSTILPDDDFIGLTVCLRALVIDKNDYARVEFADARLELGVKEL